MIAIIADDFTGAGELAGISLRYGLKVELCVDQVEYKDADVLVVCTDSRSLNSNEAIAVTGEIVKQVLELEPSLIYKKIDSVLRGHVLDEIKVQMKLMKMSKVFIMPANPSLGRTILNGEYFVNGIKIAGTAFANDPEFPVRTSSIKSMLNDEVGVLKPTDQFENGIVVGEVSRFEDYEDWVTKSDQQTMLVGAGDFFTALLDKYLSPKPQRDFEMQLPHLYVSGTAFSERREAIKELNCVSWLPTIINEAWLKKTGEIIKKNGKAVLAIDESKDSSQSLRTRMAKAVKEIVEGEKIKEIFIEGGSTAGAILKELNIKTLEPTDEPGRGVVRLRSLYTSSKQVKPSHLFITVKPGSYELPKQINELYFLK